ncbi:g150 [Coccomyxa viridis]|uniref:G150 protein n=1 Tax=Coccomyxa viridis TaxID=1274662 RepID=A0ABP1FKB2_9CHLO
MAALVALLCLACSAVPALGQFSWTQVADQGSPSKGDGTFYGQQDNQDAAGACSYSANFANSNSLPWSKGTDMTVALNDAQWAGGAGCGLCVRFRGTGAGIGTTPISTSEWKTGFVNNRCPECSHGDLDLNHRGDGRWKIEWYAVPCPVGDTNIRYDIVVSSQYWFSLVISNTRVPVAGVEIKLGGSWVPLKRSSNNQWPYYNTNGPWQSSFPMPIRITSAAGEAIEDSIPSAKGGDGTKQFGGAGGASGGNSTSYNSTNSSSSSPAASSPASSPAGSSPASSPSPAADSSKSNSSSPGSPAASSSPPASPAGSSPAWSPSPAADSSKNSSSSPSPAAATAPASSNSSSSSSPLPAGTVKMYIEDYGQCGGNALDCGKGSTTPCISASWPTAVCKSSGWSCNRYDDGLFQCQPPKSGASTSSSSNYAVTAVGGRRRLMMTA